MPARRGPCSRRASTPPSSPRGTPARCSAGFFCGGEKAEKPLTGLSGGERRRLSLAILVQSGSNVLILDEPTNHLDVESREGLEDALSEFSGSLLLISHDRALLDAVGTRTIAFEDRTLHSYVGGWPEYLRVREERAAEEVAAKQMASAGRANHKPVPRRAAGPTDTKGAAKLEQQIEAAEAALRVVEDELADPGAWETPAR